MIFPFSMGEIPMYRVKVPLVHDPALLDYEFPPSGCLRVRGMAALKQPAKNGPLLAHCGGPGSGRRCAMDMSSLVKKNPWWQCRQMEKCMVNIGKSRWDELLVEQL
jgi:hypothetical protein